MTRSFYAIVNPAAGDEKTRDTLRGDVRHHLGVEPTFTRGPGDAACLAEAAAGDGVERLVVVGGDGTVNEVVNGLRRSGVETLPELALCPAGTGNDFARGLGLPHELDAGLELARDGVARPMDLVRIDRGTPGSSGSSGDPGDAEKPRWMINVASGGFGREVADEVDKETKKSWGPLAYLKTACAMLNQTPNYRLRMAFDEEDEQTVEASAVLIINGRFVGGGQRLLEDAEPDDGQLHVMTVTANTFYERVAVASKFIVKQHLDSDSVDMRRVQRVALRCDPAMGFSIDGEPSGQTPITFTLEPAALDVVVPTKPDDRVDQTADNAS